MEPIIDAIIYIANCYHFFGVRTLVLRDEDINFPPSTDNFNPALNPAVKAYSEI